MPVIKYNPEQLYSRMKDEGYIKVSYPQFQSVYQWTKRHKGVLTVKKYDTEVVLRIKMPIKVSPNKYTPVQLLEIENQLDESKDKLRKAEEYIRELKMELGHHLD
jgi:hypothetical protein